MPPETPPPTCARCPEADTLLKTAAAIGRMEGTLEAIRVQTTKTNGAIGTLDARADTHRSRLDLHSGRIKTLEGSVKASKKRWETWTERGWKLAVAILLFAITVLLAN